jgi:predicted MPP superfamily phosphohydrolase
VIALALGVLTARRGPHVRRVDIRVDGLAPDLDGLRIAQISDLHVGPTIGRPFVEAIVEAVNRLQPDVVAITGDRSAEELQAQLYQQIGQLKVELDWLKKKVGLER